MLPSSNSISDTTVLVWNAHYFLRVQLFSSAYIWQAVRRLFNYLVINKKKNEWYEETHANYVRRSDFTLRLLEECWWACSTDKDSEWCRAGHHYPPYRGWAWRHRCRRPRWSSTEPQGYDRRKCTDRKSHGRRLWRSSWYYLPL